MSNSIKQTYDQFMNVKTRAESIIDSINNFLIDDIEDKPKVNQLINSIEIDRDNMLIHLQSVDDLINDPV